MPHLVQATLLSPINLIHLWDNFFCLILPISSFLNGIAKVHYHLHVHFLFSTLLAVALQLMKLPPF